MQLALRPFTTAGVALVGAGVIAVSPLAPPPVAASATTNTVSTTASVQLTASSFVDPIAYWGDVLELTNTNLSKIFAEASADPFPVLRQVMANQTGYANTISTALVTTVQDITTYFSSDAVGNFKSAITQATDLLAQGDLIGAYGKISGSITVLGAAASPMLPLLAIPYQIVQNAANILKALSKQGAEIGIISKVAFGLLGAAQLAGRSVVDTAQTIVDAAETGDPISIASAIVNSPAHLTDAWLNGPITVLPNGQVVRGAGFLKLGSYQYGLNWSPISALIYVPRAIAAAITPPPTPAITTAQLDSSSTTSNLALPAGSPTAEDASATQLAIAAEPSSTPASDPSPALVVSAPAEPQQDGPAQGATTAAIVNVSSEGATDLSDSSKATPSKAATTAARPTQKLKASLQNTAKQVDKGIKKLGSNIEKSVKTVSDRISTAGKKKAAASSKNDNAGSSSNSGNDD
ncbi:hypothetical protein [Mycolicibacterium fortuitum]|uniref:hypothetical protein n=1 Tax=Mycolicibacterium fortuitum TaxID=1766 RepID=UPI000A7583BC|nr:hypothetical protein [Mycolicibacterium fortuitum]NOQ59289.1 hypothetical protein [Mycolicibacterium fortuitum]